VQITDWLRIQAADMKFIRPMTCCSKRDRIINEDIRTEFGIFSLNKKQKHIETKASPGTCISNQAI
jgi:hypothetical protein